MTSFSILSHFLKIVSLFHIRTSIDVSIRQIWEWLTMRPFFETVSFSLKSFYPDVRMVCFQVMDWSSFDFSTWIDLRWISICIYFLIKIVFIVIWIVFITIWWGSVIVSTSKTIGLLTQLCTFASIRCSNGCSPGSVIVESLLFDSYIRSIFKAFMVIRVQVLSTCSYWLVM